MLNWFKAFCVNQILINAAQDNHIKFQDHLSKMTSFHYSLSETQSLLLLVLTDWMFIQSGFSFFLSFCFEAELKLQRHRQREVEVGRILLHSMI